MAKKQSCKKREEITEKDHYIVMHCSVCHHEWQSVSGKPETCDWCGNKGYAMKRRKQ